MLTEYRKSRFITTLAVISMCVAFYSIVENYSTLSLGDSPEYQLVRQFMPSAVISPVSIYFEICLNGAAIIVSVGLFLRLNWGRMMYMVVLSVVTIWEIYSSISSYLKFNELLSGFGLGSSFGIISFWVIVGIGINIFLLWKLSSDEVKSEFEQKRSFSIDV